MPARLLPLSDELSRDIKPIRLYRDDVERVFAILDSAGMKPIISDDENEFDTFDDVEQLRGRRPKGLRIEGSIDARRMERLTISLGDDSARVYCWRLNEFGPTPHHIVDLLQRREAKVIKVLSSFAWIALWIGGSVMYFVFLSASHALAYVAAGAAMIGSIGTVTGYLAKRVLCGLDLSRRHESGLLRRNRDTMVPAIATIVGAIIGALITVWFCSRQP